MDYRQVLQRDTVLDGKYRIDHVLGSGGFGITYEAFDLTLQIPVAIKEYFPEQFGFRDETLTIRPRTTSDQQMFDRLRASFLREGRILAQFANPSIVSVSNVFEARGTAYIVMRFEKGQSFKVWLANLGRPPSQDELDRIAAPVLDALEVMHAAEFLHRDIAPDNIIIRPDGSPVILDFGASRRVIGLGQMTSPMTGVVKQGYSPQEQYAGDGRTQGPWTDIYAMGATLYRAVAGVAPTEAIERMLGDHLRPAREAARGTYRPEFLDAIDEALSVRPADRPQTIDAWRSRLFSGMPVPVRDVPVAAAAVSASLAVGSQDAAPPLASETAPLRQTRAVPDAASGGLAGLAVPASVSPPPGRNLTRIGVIFGAVVVAAGMLLAMPYLRQSSSTPSPPPSGSAETAVTPRPLPQAPPIALPPDRQASAVTAIEPAAVADAAARRDLVADIRTELNRVGCVTGATSPGWADSDQKALELFVRSSGNTISFLELNRDVVKVVAGFRDRVCPLQCAAGEQAVEGRCGTIAPSTAPTGQGLSQSIQCNQINERAQLGVLTDADREQLRSLRCR